MARRTITRRYVLSEDDLNEAMALLFKARDWPPRQADDGFSVTDASGSDIMGTLVIQHTQVIE
jgi:hypothetical protein